jgi:hypothetical protein
MTYQQPGAYPGIPSYPGGAGLPPKPPLPPTVQRAFQCMIVGAVLSVVGVVVSFIQLGSIRSTLEKGLPNDSPSTIDSLVTATIVAAVVVALIEIGLWLWMAFAAKAGKNYARIVGTVFFGINAAGTLFATVGFFATSDSGTSSSTFASSDTSLGQVTDWLTFFVGLAAVVLLWRKESSRFFKPEPLYPAYGYPGYAGYPGYPGYGAAPGYGGGYPDPGQPGYPAAAPAQPYPAPAAEAAAQPAPPQDPQAPQNPPQG